MNMSSFPRRRTSSRLRHCSCCGVYAKGSQQQALASSLTIVGVAVIFGLTICQAEPAGPQGFTGRTGFQLCDDVYVAQPTSVGEIQNMLTNSTWTNVKAVAAGISFAPWACPRKTSSNSGRRLLVQMSKFASFMELDTRTHTVTVDTGFGVADLSIYLQKQGYSLTTYGLFVNGSVGGSFLAGFHGSTTKHGTLSSSIVGAEMVLANGTLLNVTPSTRVTIRLRRGQPRQTIRLLPALRLSFGRFGIVTRLKIKVIKDYPIYRTVTEERVSRIPSLISYLFKKGNEDIAEGTMLNWYPGLDRLRVHSYKRRDDLAPVTTASPAIYDPSNLVFPGTVVVPQYAADIMRNLTTTTDVFYNNPELIQRWMFDYFYNSPREVNRAIWHSVGLGETFFANWYLGSLLRGIGGKLPYQFEVAVDLNKADACFNQLQEAFDASAKRRQVLYLPVIIRLVNGVEDRNVLLSPTLGKPAVYFRIDHVSYHFPSPYNREAPFRDLEKVLLSKTCDGRVHWNLHTTDWATYGKQAKRQYGDRLKVFKAVADALDPAQKFATVLDKSFF